MKLLYFPGSPGIQNEILELSSYLEPEHQIVDQVNFDEPTVLLAYSWGVVSALQFSQLKNYHVKASIFISPFVKPKKAIISYILRIPWLSDFLLNLVKKKAIEKFINNTAYPEVPTQFYRSLVPKLSKNSILKQSILEKAAVKGTVVDDLIRKYSSQTLLLLGVEDKISNYQNNKEKFLKGTTTLIQFPNYGHAIHIMHPQETAQHIKEFLNTI